MKPSRWMMPYLTGKCFDFALALAERVDDPVFVAVGGRAMPEHVGLRIGDRYADVRGVLDEAGFLAHHEGLEIETVSRADVELHCGLSGFKPPYKGNADIREARRAVDHAMSTGMEQEIDEALAAAALRP